MHNSINIYFGQTAAITAAFLWAFATLLYNRVGKELRPTLLNLLKSVLAMLLLILTSVIVRDAFNYSSSRALTLLLLSGALGIGVGDTAFFKSLNCLGARKALLIWILAPPFTGIIAFIFLGESLSLLAWLGIILTVLGIAWVIAEKKSNGNIQTSKTTQGILFGILSALCQAGGAVLSRLALTSTDISPLNSSIIRLFGGVIILLMWIMITKNGNFNLPEKNSIKNLWSTLLLAVFIGTYICIWLQQIALKYTEAGIAQTLLATSHLFLLPADAIRYRRISLRAILGALIATCGIVFLFKF